MILPNLSLLRALSQAQRRALARLFDRARGAVATIIEIESAQSALRATCLMYVPRDRARACAARLHMHDVRDTTERRNRRATTEEQRVFSRENA
jgi:hypothetical protein